MPFYIVAKKKTVPSYSMWISWAIRVKWCSLRSFMCSESPAEGVTVGVFDCMQPLHRLIGLWHRSTARALLSNRYRCTLVSYQISVCAAPHVVEHETDWYAACLDFLQLATCKSTFGPGFPLSIKCALTPSPSLRWVKETCACFSFKSRLKRVQKQQFM